MARHATDYALANKGVDTRTLQAYLGHYAEYRNMPSKHNLAAQDVRFAIVHSAYS